MLDKKHDPWVRRRESGEYAMVTIVSCKYADWWYADFIGLTFFAELVSEDRFQKKKPEVRRLKEVIAVRLLGVVKHSGRDDAEDIVIS